VWVTDERLTAEQTINIARDGLAGGVTAIHMRRHDLTAAEFFALASKLRKIVAEARAYFIINDRVDVALAVKADGIHLGRHGLPLGAARAIVSGAIASVGYSAHSESEIAQAAIQGADYCSISPIFTPISKEAKRPPLGLEGLRRAAARSVLPLVALGGITLDNCAECVRSGAAGVETSGALSEAQSPSDMAQAFAKALGG
jgi:thiamine-phosphate pyrophosphorylase